MLCWVNEYEIKCLMKTEIQLATQEFSINPVSQELILDFV